MCHMVCLGRERAKNLGRELVTQEGDASFETSKKCTEHRVI